MTGDEQAQLRQVFEQPENPTVTLVCKACGLSLGSLKRRQMPQVTLWTNAGQTPETAEGRYEVVCERCDCTYRRRGAELIALSNVDGESLHRMH